MQEKKAISNRSVLKTFAIIEQMAQYRGSMRLQDIAAACDMPPSTTLRLLNTLERLGYIVQNPSDSQYQLTLKFNLISEGILSQIDMHALVHPYLIQLSKLCKESSCLAIERDMTVVYIDVVTGPDNMIKTMQYIGKFAPMHCTGVGKLMLTNYSEEKLTEYVSKKGLALYTPHTIGTIEQLTSELQTIKQNGYGIDDEECELGARCIAAPIRDYTNKIVACISVSGPTTRMNMKQLEYIKPIIIDIAAKISSTLAYKSKIAEDLD